MRIQNYLTYALIGLVIGMLCLTAAVGLVAGWGWKQAITVEHIKSVVRKGMTPDQIASALGQPPDAYDKAIRRHGDSLPKYAEYSISISRSGFGSMFAPQHNIVLYLDHDRRATVGIDKIVYELDEESERIELGKRTRPFMCLYAILCHNMAYSV